MVNSWYMLRVHQWAYVRMCGRFIFERQLLDIS